MVLILGCANDVIVNSVPRNTTEFFQSSRIRQAAEHFHQKPAKILGEKDGEGNYSSTLWHTIKEIYSYFPPKPLETIPFAKPIIYAQ